MDYADNVTSLYDNGDEDQKDSVYGKKSPAEWHKFWCKELEAYQKRTRKFKQQGERIVERFIDERKGRDTYLEAGWQQYSLNLFHANVSTLQSMLYGSTPQIEVTREHHDPDDDIARVASVLFQRMLDADVDPSGDGFPTVLRACLQDRLLPGLGIARVRHEVETEVVEQLNPMTGEMEQVEVFLGESAPIDYVHWNDFAWSWGRTWRELHWIGFRNYLTKDQATARFGAEKANGLNYKLQTFDQAEENQSEAENDMKSVLSKAEVWEIWCKDSKKVYWVSKGCDECLDCKDDPLGLDGFWPVPKPMIANQTTKMFMPTGDFILSQDLYNQIDTLYTRITIITRAVKVVGVYDQAAGQSVGRMLKEGMENDLIPVDNWAMFAEGGGLRGKIDWFPVEAVVQTLQTLRSVLQEQIELLYQVTGMSDILRGQSQQYSGVGQEQMKAKFGSIRVQALQDDFARFASELEELRAEVISKHFEPTSIVEQSNAQFMPRADQQMVQPALQLMKSPQCRWRVNIRPESIAMVDYQSLKAERTEYIMAISQYIQSAQAMAGQIPESLPILLEMMKWGVAGFKGANYLEGILDQAIQGAIQAQQNQQQNQQPSPEQIKAQTEQMKMQAQQQKSQMELQKMQMKAQSDLQLLQTKMQGELAKIQTKAQYDGQVDAAEAQARMQELITEFQNDIRVIQTQLDADIAVETAQAEFDIANKQAEHEMTMREMATQAALSQRGRDGQ